MDTWVREDIFLFSTDIFGGKKNIWEHEDLFCFFCFFFLFLLSTDIFNEKHERASGKNLAIAFSQIWLTDRKGLPNPGLGDNV